MTDRYVFICDPADQAAEKEAFALARALTDNGQKPLTYLAPGVRDFGMFDFALDQAHIRKLINRNFVDLKIGAEEIVTYQTIRPFSVQGVVLGLRCIPEAIHKDGRMRPCNRHSFCFVLCRGRKGLGEKTRGEDHE